jgi:release factor glutamine methyltransferase
MLEAKGRVAVRTVYDAGPPRKYARMATTDALLREARIRLAAAGADDADAEVLLAAALDRSRAWLFAHGADALESGAADRFEAMLARREAGEPVAYITGRRGFWRFDLRVTPDTLVPRPETELLVELALERLPEGKPLRIADLGTGSGAIALALAHERPAARVVAVDASAAALEVARGNARALGIGNVEFREGDWLRPLAGDSFDLVASNPPYIALGDPHLDDLRHEPALALTSGADGLDAIRAIVRDAPACLAAGGWLLLEHGLDQGPAVRALLASAGYADVATARDLEQRDRVTLGRYNRGQS